MEVAGARASYREAGSGAVAILTPGLGLTSRFYRHSYPAFAAAGIRLIVPDLPGWGDTPGPHSGIGAAATAVFLRDFAAALHVTRAVWIGHSVGAQAVVELAVRRPDLARGIVLVGPTGTPGRGAVLRQARGLVVETFRTSLPVIGAVAREYVHTTPVRYVGTWLRHARHDMVERVQAVQCPTLVLAGRADPICRPAFVALLRQRLPNARVEWVREGTHALPRGHAAAFNRIVTGWVNEVARGG